MFSRDGTLSHEMHRVLRHGTGVRITAPLHPPSAPEQGSDLVCLHLQGLPMARQALDKGDITGAKEILREMDRYLQDVLWTTVTMPQDPGGAPASDAVTRPKAERQRPAKAR